ncbi:MAG TPA: hypothetical protein VF512_00565 [Actinomycetota bacterium]
MRRRLLAVLSVGAMVAALAAGVAPASGAGGSAPRLRNLDPGGPARFSEKVPVNLVFVGYERDQVSKRRVLAGLPHSYKPLNRNRLFYGVTEPLGIRYTYDYDVTYAGAGYERKFFSTLSRLARPAPLTELQQQYNDQVHNVLEVTSNHHIDAPTVERWLALHPPAGVDTRQNTIFFVNWYGRPDFKFHVYTKTDEPEPDTGFNFGADTESRKLIAWGGTTPDDEEDGLGKLRRVWFYDLSAGPESWTDNWNVDDADLDGDDVPDYRMPPIWEYTKGGFRAPGALSGDLSKVARYVGINLLFTSSPSYSPELTPPDLPHTVNIDSNTYEAIPGVNASRRYIKPGLLLQELSELQPTTRFSYDNQDLPLTGKARQCYDLWLPAQDTPCYPDLDYPAFANLFLFNALHLERTQDDAGRVDYELPNFNYATTNAEESGLLGYADDNYRTGTQSFVFNFVSPAIAENYGLTTTMIHEDGHHLAMSHPHDGYDSETGVDYEPTGPYYFAWSGDESNTMMSYIDLNWDFSQFDRDNMNRYMAAAFAHSANVVAADILADPDAGRAADELASADSLLGASRAAFRGHRYLAASFLAKGAYDLVRKGARQAGVAVVGSHDGWQVDEPGSAAAAAAKLDDATTVDHLGPRSHRLRR